MTSERNRKEAREVLGFGEFKHPLTVQGLQALLEKESINHVQILPDGSISASDIELRLAEALDAAERRVRKETLEECAKVAEKYPMQFGCDGKHWGVGTNDCPKTYHHHDDRCKHPVIGIAEAIRKLEFNAPAGHKKEK